MFFICPVCGYDGVVAPPKDHSIFAFFGTPFCYHDYGHTIGQLRHAWCMKGGPWYSRRVPRPVGWNPLTQLTNSIGYFPTIDERIALQIIPTSIHEIRGSASDVQPITFNHGITR